MSKIAIISQPDEGVLIDVGGCSDFQEAILQLTSTLHVSSQFWKGNLVSLNLGKLELSAEQFEHVIAIAKGVGATPAFIFSQNDLTRSLVIGSDDIKLGEGEPMTVLSIAADFDNGYSEDENRSRQNRGTPASASSSTSQATQKASQSADTETRGISGDTEISVTILPEPAYCLLPQFISGEHGSSPMAGSSQMAGSSSIPGSSSTPEYCAVDFGAAAAADCRAHAGAATNTSLSSAADSKAPSAAPQEKPLPQTLYLVQNLRSGQTVSHKGHLVVIGDVNSGAEILAEGDITVWGALRGVAHAGIGGNITAEIRALRLQPLQIRIAHTIARSPDNQRMPRSKPNIGPEVARIVQGKIKIFRNNIDETATVKQH